MFRNMSKSTNVINKLSISKVKFPEKFKGTLLEKWADYWKNLFIDYRQMFQDLRSDIQEQPKKAFVWGLCLTATYALMKNNPSEIDFKNYLKCMTNEVILVSAECLNNRSVEHLRYVNKCYNEGVVHYRNFGFASIMYVSEINDTCDLYKSQCPYLKPTLFSYPSRIIDVGVMGKWWNIYIKTTNYDVNM